MKVRIKYVVEDTDRHGNVRVYLRKPGQSKIRLPTPIGSLEFWREYQRVLSGAAPPPKVDLVEERKKQSGSFEWLCNQYYRAAVFQQLSPRTQGVRRGILQHIVKLGGGLPACELSAKHIRRWRDQKADKPESANGMIKALRQVYAFAVEYEITDRNPAKDVPYLSSNSDGFHAWSIDEVLQYERTHPIGTKARLVFALLLYTGQRRADIVRLGKQHVSDGWIRLTQQKNERRRPITVEIPLIAELRTIIERSPTGDLTFLVTEFGRPFTSNGFGNRFRKWCDEAGLPQCSAHGLRKAAASRLAELGCTELEIMSVTGHSTSKEVERYTRAARRRVLAKSAMAKFSSGSEPDQE